jgi:hypothetical protein
LEVQVVEKFKRYDSRDIQKLKHELPHLSNANQSRGPAGHGSVAWVGYNKDPCKAKYLAKCGIRDDSDFQECEVSNGGWSPHGTVSPTSLSMSQSEPAVGLDRMFKIGCLPKGLRKPRISCNERYLEQKLGLVPEVAPKMNKSVLSGLRQTGSLKELMYVGVSHDGQGRRAYLQARGKIMPQDRLVQPLTAAAVVGWNSYAGRGKIIDGRPAPVLIPDNRRHLETQFAIE